MFDDPAHVREDMELLERLRDALRAAPRTPGEQRLHLGDEQHRIVVPDWDALAAPGAVVGVGFFGQARAAVDHGPLARFEDDIVARAAAFTGLLAYHNARLGPAHWANLVVFADPTAVGGLRFDDLHETAVALTAEYYDSLRLHRGAFAGGALGEAPYALERTLFLDFSETPARRWVRAAV